MSKIFQFNFSGYGKKSQNVLNTVEMLKNGLISMEEILSQDDLINDINLHTNSALSSHLKQKDIKDLIKYIITEPENDEYNIGHRFPFIACDILSRENLVIVEKIFENKNDKKEDFVEKSFDDLDTSSPTRTKSRKNSDNRKENKVIKTSESQLDLRETEINSNKKLYDSLDNMSLDKLNKILDEEDIKENNSLKIVKFHQISEVPEGKDKENLNKNNNDFDNLASDNNQASLLLNFNHMFKNLKKSKSTKECFLFNTKQNLKNNLITRYSRKTSSNKENNLNKSLDYSNEDKLNNSFDNLTESLMSDKKGNRILNNSNKNFLSENINYINFNKTFEKINTDKKGLKNDNLSSKLNQNKINDRNNCESIEKKDKEVETKNIDVIDDLKKEIINSSDDKFIIDEEKNYQEEKKNKNVNFEDNNSFSNLNELMIISDDETFEQFNEKDNILVKDLEKEEENLEKKSGNLSENEIENIENKKRIKKKEPINYIHEKQDIDNKDSSKIVNINPLEHDINVLNHEQTKKNLDFIYNDSGNQPDFIEEMEKNLEENKTNNENVNITIEEILNEEYEIIDYLLSFLDTDKPLNYVLCGYFSKVILSLKYSKPNLLIKYLIRQRRNYINRMIYHFNRKAIADCFFKIISKESDISSEFTLEEEINFKIDIIHDLINNLITNVNDDEKCENIVDFLSEIFKEKKLFAQMIKNKELKKIFFQFSNEIIKIKKELIEDENNQKEDVFLENSLKYKNLLYNSILICLKMNENVLLELNSLNSNSKNDLNAKNKCEDDSIENSKKENFETNIKNIQEKANEIFIDPFDDINYKTDNREIEYLHVLDIFKLILPLVLEFYADSLNRPKKKFLATFNNKDVEMLGAINLSIVELIKNLFEIINLNIKLKAFGYNILEEENGKIIYFFEDCIKILNILKEKNFFRQIFEDLIKYDMNNCLQIFFKSIISEIIDLVNNVSLNLMIENLDNEDNEILSKNCNELIHIFLNYLFDELNLVDFIIFNTLDKTVDFENSRFSINTCYLTCLLEISDKINHSKEKTPILNNKLENYPKWNVYSIIFANPVNKKFKDELMLEKNYINFKALQYSNYSNNFFNNLEDFKNGQNNRNIQNKCSSYKLYSMKENFIQYLRKKAKYALITNEFHLENYLDVEEFVDLSNFKRISIEKDKYYDNHYWLQTNSSKLNEFDENSILNDLN